MGNPNQIGLFFLLSIDVGNSENMLLMHIGICENNAKLILIDSIMFLSVYDQSQPFSTK